VRREKERRGEGKEERERTSDDVEIGDMGDANLKHTTKEVRGEKERKKEQ
jgi:hypothetical protein